MDLPSIHYRAPSADGDGAQGTTPAAGGRFERNSERISAKYTPHSAFIHAVAITVPGALVEVPALAAQQHLVRDGPQRLMYSKRSKNTATDLTNACASRIPPETGLIQ